MHKSQVLKVWQKQIKPGQVLQVEVLPESFWYDGLRSQESKTLTLTVADTMLQFDSTVLHIWGTFTHPVSAREFSLYITITSTLEQFNAVNKHWTGYVVKKLPKETKTQCAESA